VTINDEMESAMTGHTRMTTALISLLWLISSGFAVSASAQVSKSALKNGKAQFTENCEVCHQADAIGAPGVAPSLTNP
jgi:mono/diheme cytochrome c family protein